MKTEIVPAIGDHPEGTQTAATDRAAQLLKEGEVVALPTETVYGLAADALRPEAVVKIFEAKARPRFDPLIVHLPDTSWLEKLTNVPTQDEQLVLRLVRAFWPGPFTIVLPKRDIVPDIVTAGLETVAVRISAHPVFTAVIQAFGSPLAAPSANRFGRISPTTAAHVLSELDGRIPLIVDGGLTTHGVESTVISIRQGKIQILRPGPISPEQLATFGEVELVGSMSGVVSPGQLPSHYAPRTPLQCVPTAGSFQPRENQRVGVLAWARMTHQPGLVAVRSLSESQDLREAATNLFRCLRELDEAQLDLIIAETVPNEGIGVAINDRLRRAQGYGGLTNVRR